MELTAVGKHIETALLRNELTQGERFCEQVMIHLPDVYQGIDISGCAFVMRGMNSKGELSEDVLVRRTGEAHEVLLLWEISSYMTAVEGKLQLELLGTQGERLVIKFQLDPIWVKKTVNGRGLPQPDVIEAKLNEMNRLLDQAKNHLVDPTLSQEGKAADAQVTGHTFVSISSAQAQVSGEVVAARTWGETAFPTLSARLAAEFDSKVDKSELAAWMASADSLSSDGVQLCRDVSCLPHTAAGNAGIAEELIGIFEIIGFAGNDMPMVIDIGRSGDSVQTRYTILFSDIDGMPTSFTAYGMGGSPVNGYLGQTDTGRWRLYVAKSSAAQKICVLQMTNYTHAELYPIDEPVQHLEEIRNVIPAIGVS